MELNIDRNYIIELMEKIIHVPSPIGYYEKISGEMKREIQKLGFRVSTNNKGDLYVELEGKDNSKTVAVTAHLDTIGLMVSKINDNGTIKTINLGGINYYSIEGESVIIHTRGGVEYTGLVCCDAHSLHLFPEARTMERSENTMHIVIDEKVGSKQDVLELGIRTGDHISINPGFEYTNSGFIKSRFIDDKGCVASVMAMLRAISESREKPQYRTICIFTQYEEISYGGSFVPAGVSEYVAVDIGAVGPDQAGTEYEISISAKDVWTVYDRTLVTKLANIADENSLPYRIDTYVGAATDASQAVRAGHDIKAAAMGPYTYATHGKERTHIETLENTAKLLLGYILKNN